MVFLAYNRIYERNATLAPSCGAYGIPIHCPDMPPLLAQFKQTSGWQSLRFVLVIQHHVCRNENRSICKYEVALPHSQVYSEWLLIKYKPTGTTEILWYITEL